MRNPYEYDDYAVSCGICGEDIDDGEYVWLAPGNSNTCYCYNCMADECERDENGEIINDDWTCKEPSEYVADELEYAREVAEDAAFDEMRDRQFFGDY